MVPPEPRSPPESPQQHPSGSLTSARRASPPADGRRELRGVIAQTEGRARTPRPPTRPLSAAPAPGAGLRPRSRDDVPCRVWRTSSEPRGRWGATHQSPRCWTCGLASATAAPGTLRRRCPRWAVCRRATWSPSWARLPALCCYWGSPGTLRAKCAVQEHVEQKCLVDIAFD